MPSSRKRKRSDHSTVQGVSGGSANRAYTAQVMNIGQESSDIELLKARTHKLIQNWTKGMVRIPNVSDIAKKLTECSMRWMTIKGFPGEGKTTFGYMLLDEMKKGGFDVFVIDTPEDYYAVSALPNSHKCVMMFNGMVGKVAFDATAFSRWRKVIDEIVGCRVQSYEGRYASYVVFVGTNSVIEGILPHYGMNEQDIFKQNLFDLTEAISQNENVQLKILNHHLEKGQITIDDETKTRICSIASKHGFSYSCKMFVYLKSKGHDIHISKYFLNPFQFLDQPMKSLLQDKKINDLLMLLMENGGKFDIDEISDDRRRARLREAERHLSEHYLKRENDCTIFQDQSIYDSVAFTKGREDPLFVVKNCTISFIMERVKMTNMDERNDKKNQVYLHFKMSAKVQEQLKNRFAEVLKKNEFSILEHEACSSETFLQNLLNEVFPKGVGINERDKQGGTMLMVAARCGNNAALRSLINRGADVTMKSLDKKRNVLHYLGMREKVDNSIIDQIIDKGVDVNVPDSDGQSFLHYICKGGVLGADVFQNLLKKHNPHVMLQDNNGRIPLHLLCATNRPLDENAVQLLIQYGSDIRDADKDGRVPLHFLCMSGTLSTSILKSCFDGIGDLINSKDHYGRTPLHYACQRQGAEVSFVEALIRKGADPCIKDSEMNTPLHFACQRKEKDVTIIRILVQNGADPKQIDQKKKVPYQYLCDEKKIPSRCVIEYLVNKVDDIVLLEDEHDRYPSPCNPDQAKKLINTSHKLKVAFDKERITLSMIMGVLGSS